MRNNNKHSGEKQVTAAGTNLDRLVRDIKEKVQQAKDFWVQLPYTICNGEIAAQPNLDNDCWNGQDRARYRNGFLKIELIKLMTYSNKGMLKNIFIIHE